MKRDKHTVGLRNTLSMMAMQMDSCAVMNSMTPSERERIQNDLRRVVQFIDGKIGVSTNN